MTKSTVTAGTVLGSRWLLEKPLGRGGMASVYLAMDLETPGPRVAVKILELAGEENARRFEREARMALRLDHPRCVRVLDAGHDPATQVSYLVMELMPGASLADRLVNDPRVNLEAALSVAAHLAEALAHAASLGIVHRDVKPANFLFGDETFADGRLADFGLARTYLPEGTAPLTAQGQIMGTPAYMAPEQARGEAVEAAADVFAWGATVYQLLAGTLPDPAPTPVEQVIRRASGEPIVPLLHRAPRIDPELARLVMQALELDPERRPSAHQIVERVLGFGAPTERDEPAVDPTVVSAGARRDANLPREVGDWQLDAVIGQGAHGIVYRARHRALNRDFAIKALRPEHSRDERSQARLAREARILADLSHPNLVSIEPPFTHEGQLFVPMELLEGSALDVALNGEGSWISEDVIELGRQIADALTLAHERGVLHRDLKPSNLFVTGRSPMRIKVLDFGVARLAGDATMTKTGDVLGTPLYLAPELLAGAGASAATDLFALGVVLYEACTGRFPFAISKELGPWPMIAALARAQKAGPEPISPTVHPQLRQLILRCLSVDPTQRPPSARSLAAELKALSRGRSPDEVSTRASRCQDCGALHFEASCPRCRERRGPAKRKSGWSMPALGPWAAIALIGVVGIGLRLVAGAYSESSSRAEASVMQQASVKAAPSTAPASTPTPSLGSDATRRKQRPPPASGARRENGESFQEHRDDALRPAASPTGPSKEGMTRYELMARSAEARQFLAAIRVGQEQFRAEMDFYAAIKADGPGGSEPEYFDNRDCSRRCYSRSPTACDEFSCIGVRPNGRMFYRYACETIEPGSRRTAEFTCAAVADLDGDGRPKMFVYGTANSGRYIKAPIPRIGPTGSCREGHTHSGEIVDCDPDEW